VTPSATDPEAAVLEHSFAVLRGYTAAESVALARMLWDFGLRNVEVPTLTSDAWEAFAAVAAEASDTLRAGIGSARTAADVERAHALGGRFVVSAGFSDELVGAAAARRIDLIPGVLSPSEILRAAVAGCRTVKLFPAGAVGPAYVKALLAPFPDMRFVAVGGVGLENAADFLRAGAVGVGIGSSLLPARGFGPEGLDAARGALEALRERIHSQALDSQPKG